MSDTGIVDTFLDTFTSYIDSGFGLLGGEVGFLSSTLIAIDVTIAGLFWAWGADEDVIQRLVKKTLYIGAFAFIIGNFQTLATILFDSFAGLGLKASGDALSLAEFMKPGTIAAKGLDAAQPLIDAMEAYNSLWSVFANLAIIAVLLLAYLIVVLAFFIIAIQIFITLIEFKLVTLAGFVLLPFAFWNRTAFMAEKVLGHIVSSGIKVLVLAVITGIGTTLFSTFTATVGPEPDARQVLAIALGALSLLGLSIFGPGIANGIVSGGPQLGAGAAAGTVLAAGGALVGGAAAAKLGVGAAASTIGATGRMGAAAAQGGARMAGGAAGAYSVGSLGRSGAGAVAGGMAAVGQTAATGAVNAALSPLRRMAGKASASMKDNFRTGARAGLGVAPASGSPAPAASPAAPASAPPAWASAMKQRQSATHGATVLAHTMKAGDSHGGGGGPDVKERE
ncbi:P-type conjugative transfer protein TrbL [Sphingomonas koreensis]|uniref:P-type conjugative transfer protein TrbL n=9 Tax=Sphingomonadales TaxID=204457 RepID=A0A1L6J8A3_9SPHN|nr:MULTISPECIES: P-type conjugative transfer protein TrbL [Pseudomonadota]MAF62135.1 P-type conjugative transfer protein TrbL [Blastomonas sp.]MBZ6382661.1 P-type conjugative transfer protein TrbL [Sphingomonas sanguinis]OJY69964.1 MAG: P-type conjugative transfer protein TrbL [Sphingobium sp. 66-54]OYX47212.1 MAG: P-type conjugative transfer protein TrbL [Sphingomonadales bacterium 32-64-22]QEH77890.1 P-type conjugative transfer protein TrbL [Sphingomonas sp. C8-2]